MNSPIVVAFVLAVGATVPGLVNAQKAAPGAPEWSMNASIIEACSCPMFCQCYFSTKPAAHAPAGHEGHGHDEHFCRFNNAFRVTKGSYGATKLDGARFWVYGDLGSEFDDGEMEWAVLAFDKSLSAAQREAIQKIVGHIYPVKWKSMTTAEGEIAWTAGKGEAHATLDGGKTAEVKLGTKTLQANVPGEPVVIKNLKYWGLPRHDGFVLMPSLVEAVRSGERPFEYRDSNGFMLTFDISSKDFAAPAGR